MNKKQWVVLLFLYLTYLLFGAGVFYMIETKIESDRRKHMYGSYKEIKQLISDNYDPGVPDSQLKFMEELEEYCNKPILDKKNNNIDHVFPIQWDFYNSFFFVVTVVSTIGYGNLAPSSSIGRILMIFYALFGIPLNGILLTNLGQFFGTVFIRAHHKYKEQKHYETKCGLIMDIVIYLIPGIIVFIFIPAGAFMFFEDWTFDESVYFAFVTLTTIGFGDLVAGQSPSLKPNHHIAVFWTYRVLLLFWILFGLGYLIMLLGFITKAMSSKKIVQIEQKLVDSFVHSKIWNGLSKDMGHLRRIINEIYLDKLKPILKEEHLRQIRLSRSKSLPNIHLMETEDEIMEPPIVQRRRAFSEFDPTKIRLNRVVSENALEHIDRQATFEAARSILGQAHILMGVVDAIEDTLVRTKEEPRLRGIDIFSDDEVLQSEQNYPPHKKISTWTIGGETLEPPPYWSTGNDCRCRAASVSLPKGVPISLSDNAEWTWTGAASNTVHKLYRNQNGTNDSKPKKVWPARIPNKIITAVRGKRHNSESDKQMEYTITGYPRSRKISQDQTLNKLACLRRGSQEPPRMKHSLMVPPSNLKKRHSLQPPEDPEPLEQSYVTHTGAGAAGLGLKHGRKSEKDIFDFYANGNKLFNSDPSNEILEETSLADFLRILTTFHASMGSRLGEEEQTTRRDSSTPPGSLKDLFKEELQPPKSPDKRKFSIKQALFPPISRNESKRNSLRPPDTSIIEEKTNDSSNLKRLGRFLLRRVSKTNAPQEENLDIEKAIGPKLESETNSKPSGSERPSPSVRIQVESPTPETSPDSPKRRLRLNSEGEVLPSLKKKVSNPKWRIHQLRTEEGFRRPSF